MTTAQETSNGHRVSPPLYDDATGIVSSDLSAGAPANKVHRQRGISPEPLPPRCQFTFSDGRQCTMARSDIHPSMCPFHAEREEQLFGRPSPGGNVVGAAFDLPELYYACRDLTTAAGVNRALAQVFRLLAQRRISRQEAATFGHLAQLLLRTITLAHAESATSPAAGDRANATSPIIRSEPCERKIPPEPAPEREISPASSPVCEPVPSPQPKNGANAPQQGPINVNSSTPIAPAPCSEPPAGPPAVDNSLGIYTCADSVRNSSEINTYENVELKTLQNEHLQENGHRPRTSWPSGASRRQQS
jgi:hypothetical protein